MSRALKMELHYAITNEAIMPPTTNRDPSAIGTYVAHASLRPREPLTLTREELSQYPELPKEMQELLVKPDPNSESLNNPLELLMDLAPQWADQGMSEADIVIKIQRHCNIMFDASSLKAAKGMADEAVIRARGDTIFVPESKEVDVIGASFRDDTPSVIEIVTPDRDRRFELLTPEKRRLYGITAMVISERDFTAKQIETYTSRSESPSRIQMHSESDEENSELIGEYDD
ncbi:MAG: hypothetical protein JWN75_195 [Candidatus Saccharibacteria bacterium]|nr:hypothetical protein [Candidatus Saccharibacteria bacterium]